MSWELVLSEDDNRFFRENISLLEERVFQNFPESYRNPAILSAIRNVPRHLFVGGGYKVLAYTDNALPTLRGLTTSAPSVVARMIFLAGVSKGDRLLEVGTGTGYQAAVLAEMGVKVFSVEIDQAAADTANGILVRLGYKTDKRPQSEARRKEGLRRYLEIRRRFPQKGSIELFVGNGQRGLAERCPFNGIIIAASVQHLAPLWHLTGQLSSSGGRMVVPVGDRHDQALTILEREGDRVRCSVLEGVSFDFLRMVLKQGDSPPATPDRVQDT
jgi:protein-L-isoaspartate(D-aspartate) O-methyltransferase